MKTNLIGLPIHTRDGEFTAHYSEKGLAGLDFPKPGRNSGPKAGAIPIPKIVREWQRTTTQALKAVLAGGQPKELPPLDWTEGTAFQQKVWKVMGKIAPGKTLSYGEIASAIGKPKASRAVGGACGANPIPVLVPCHRVLAANKKIGGFSGGMDWKYLLLEREGVRVVAV
jgi:AraC family transcriptional regulator of adaptative response/methylated-DNA-[protein]-cysteine methyltransferase